MITHEAALTTIAAQLSFWQQAGIVIGQDDALLSYLPLAHIFDRYHNSYLAYHRREFAFRLMYAMADQHSHV